MEYIYSNLPNNYVYVLNRCTDNELQFRIKKIFDERAANEWLQEFSDATKSTWRKEKTYPNSGRVNIFKVDMRCVRKTDKRVTGEGPSKNTDCPAKLQIVIRRFVEKTRAKAQDSLRKEFPAIVTLRGCHNHATGNAENLKHRDMSKETLKKLHELFRKGHTAASARQCLKTGLMLEYGDNYYEVAEDGHYFPSSSKISKLFEKEFCNEYSAVNETDMFEFLESRIQQYSQTSSGNAVFSKTSDEQHYFIAICSPIMSRVHECISQSGEVVMVDTFGGMDKQRHRVYVFVTPTVAGGLPLGVIITDSEKESVFHEALLSLNNILPNRKFYGKDYPKIIIADGDIKEIGSLKKVFPECTLLLCQFNFLNAIWRWLCLSKHKIDVKDRQKLYLLVKNVLYASNENEIKIYHEMLLNCAACKKYSHFMEHYVKHWEKRESWATCYRPNAVIHSNNTTNYAEVAFKILKDCILNRALAFNITQLVDYILIRYEMYMEKWLLKFYKGKFPKALLKKMMPKENDVQKVEKKQLFCVTNRQNEEYYVDIVSGICTCVHGQSGKLCCHASAVIQYLDCDIKSAFNVAPKQVKETLSFVATGKTVESRSSRPFKYSISPNEIIIEMETSQNIDFEDDVETEEMPSIESSDTQELDDSAENEIQQNSKLTHNEESALNELWVRIWQGIQDNPTSFVPAARKMLQNSKKFAATETGLLAAMHTFSTSGELPSVYQPYDVYYDEVIL